MMRLIYALAIGSALVYAWQTGALHRLLGPCERPIAYSIGSLDRRFGLSQAELLDALAEAEAAWEAPSGRELFSYSPERADLRVNLVYDYRQAVTEELNELEEDLEAGESAYRSLEADYRALKSGYEDLRRRYEEKLESFSDQSAAYEARVALWNSGLRGSRSEFEKLEAERAALESEFAGVKSLEAELNARAKELNALVSRLNRLARSLNLNAEEYNTIGASRGETFAGGTYVSGRIDVYEFENRDKLARILAHELGHALGLEHISDPSAIMYYLNESDAGSASPSDLAALESLCK